MEEKENSEEKPEIVLKRRPDDWMAFIKGKPGYWSAGNTIDEAIGGLIRTHKEFFVKAIALEQ